jgi:hypothetical protein
MANIAVGTFTHWNLSKQEVLQGSILNQSQKQLLQNELATIGEQIVNLEYDPDKPLDFVQNDAHLKGQMAVIRYMLLRSDESEQQLQNLANSLDS